jgi:uncharacterized protein YegP (UPF0339 family)
MTNNKDNLEVYKDKAGEWRWKRIAPNNREVGASTEGYKNRRDCEANAKRQQQPTRKPTTRKK